MITDDLVHAGELLAQAQTNNSRSLRKTYLLEAKKHVENAKKEFPSDDAEAQAAIRRVEVLIRDVEYQFPEVVRAGLGENCPVCSSCHRELPEDARTCPACGNPVLKTTFGDFSGACWLYLPLGLLLGSLIFYFNGRRQRAKRR